MVNAKSFHMAFFKKKKRIKKKKKMLELKIITMMTTFVLFDSEIQKIENNNAQESR